jgi:hypothetical protein
LEMIDITKEAESNCIRGAIFRTSIPQGMIAEIGWKAFDAMISSVITKTTL